MSNAPYFFQQIQAYNSLVSPSTVHIRNTGLANFFQKYYLQKALSPFRFTLPEWWSDSYFLYTLYIRGFVGVIKTDKYGVIPQHCSLYGYNVFYQPTNIIISNPLIQSTYNPRIDVDCTLIKLMPDYSGIGDIVAYYADLAAITAEALGVNIFNSKLPFVFAAKNRAAAETFKKMYDNVSSGEPAVVVNQSLYGPDGQPAWEFLNNNLSNVFIAPKLLDVLERLDNMFLTEIGIPNANTSKRERLISAEVEANDFEVRSKCEVWLDELQKSFEKTRKMFDLSPEQLNVDWRKGLSKNDD